MLHALPSHLIYFLEMKNIKTYRAKGYKSYCQEMIISWLQEVSLPDISIQCQLPH